MPEGLEAELYRRHAERVVGRTVERVDVDPNQEFAHEVSMALPGLTIADVRRHGKVVVFDTDGPSIGIHFGMSGVLVVDGVAAIERLEYSSSRRLPEWDRLVLSFERASGGGVVRVNDPRRFSRVRLDPDLGRLGPDWTSVDRAHLVDAFADRRSAVKSVLLDQTVVAGLGNLCVDEVLWQACVAPDRRCSTVAEHEIGAVVDVIRTHLPVMLDHGGSTTGSLSPAVRTTSGGCPRDGSPLRRDVVSGRTTVWCPAHQR